MILMFLADGFEEVEALCPLDLCRRAGLDIRTVGVGGTAVRGSHGITVLADLSDKDASELAPDAVILPGGMPGTKNLAASPVVEKTIADVHARGGLLAAICAAPSVLGEGGYLVGKRATCYPGFEASLRGAILADEKVVRDGKVITAAGMGVAQAFGLAIVEALCDKETARRIETSIQAK